MTDEERLIILTNTVASIPPWAPPGTGSWLRQMQDDAHRKVFPRTHAAGRAALSRYRVDTQENANG